MKHYRESTLIRWAKEGRIESCHDIVAGTVICIRWNSSGKYEWVEVD